jgi:hypothetical protein
VANIFYISPYFEHYSDDYIPKFHSAHELVGSYMRVPPPVAQVTTLKMYLKYSNINLNEIEPVSNKSDGKNIDAPAKK